MAYEVILKPAAGDSPAPRPKSPPKERPLSQELIDKKLKEAEERRQVRRKIHPIPTEHRFYVTKIMFEVLNCQNVSKPYNKHDEIVLVPRHCCSVFTKICCHLQK